MKVGSSAGHAYAPICTRTWARHITATSWRGEITDTGCPALKWGSARTALLDGDRQRGRMLESQLAVFQSQTDSGARSALCERSHHDFQRPDPLRCSRNFHPLG